MTQAAITRRRALALGAGAAALAAPGIARAATPFVLATYGGAYERIVREHIQADFERQHDVTMRMELGNGIVFVQRLIAARNRPPFDVVFVNEDEAMLGEQARLFAPFDAARIPNISQIYDSMRPPTIPLYGAAAFELGFVYNANKVQPPRSWADIWTNDWTVAIAHPTQSYGLLFLLLAAKLNGGSEANLSPGFEQIRRLRRIKIYRGYVDGMDLFRRGEVDVAMFYRNRAIELADQGHPIRFHVPEEGSYGIRMGMQIPARAPNIQAAYSWVNLAMSAPYQNLFVPGYYSPSNRTIQMAPEMAAKHLYGPEAVGALRFADWATLNPQKSQIYERWDREFT